MAEGGARWRSLKCRKCREVLLEEPGGRLMEAREGEEGVWSLYEDQLPAWVAEAVQQVRHLLTQPVYHRYCRH